MASLRSYIRPVRTAFQAVWKRLRQRYLTRIASWFLLILVTLAIFAHAICNDRPYYAKYNGEAHFPIFHELKVDSIFDPVKDRISHFNYSTVDWRSLQLESVVWAPIPYSANRLDPFNRKPVSPTGVQVYEDYSGVERPLPKRLRHWLGTYTNGQDVLAGLIHGARVSLLVGVVGVGIAFLIGILLGALAGYFGDTRLKASRIRYLITGISLFLGYFYAFYVRSYTLTLAREEDQIVGAFLLSLAILLAIILVGQWIGKKASKVPGWWGQETTIPVDGWISRVIEVMRSVPMILVLISFSVVFGGSVTYVILIIGLMGWPGPARYIRAEFLRIVNLEYMEAARALGFKESRMILRHALPNALAPILVMISFGIAGAIMTESTLSFLNLGVGPDTVTWGSMLRRARQAYDNWWLTIFPGLFIFLTVLSFNLLGEHFRDIFDPRERGL